jgi:hypothetical protein
MVARAVLLAALAFTIAVPAALANEPNLLRVLAGPLASARKRGAKVLLPSTLAAHAPHLYGSDGATVGGYDIQLASAPGCHDANACFVAEFTAVAARPASGAVVPLADGIDGRYVASVCGASCNRPRSAGGSPGRATRSTTSARAGSSWP